MSPNARAGEWGCGVSANEYSCAYGAQINFGDGTPYFTYDIVSNFYRALKITKKEMLSNMKYAIYLPI
jgi:hypothetical protein